MIDSGSKKLHDPIFIGKYNIIHIDEKWFYMMKKFENYSLLPHEEHLIYTLVKVNFFIQKVMFSVVLAHSRLRKHFTKKKFR